MQKLELWKQRQQRDVENRFIQTPAVVRELVNIRKKGHYTIIRPQWPRQRLLLCNNVGD